MGAQNLAHRYGITVPQALALAQLANVKLQDSMTKTGHLTAQALAQIRNFVAGIGSMSAGAGQLGANLQVMEAATERSASNVTKLNQAWDQFISTGSSGFNAFVSYGQGLASIGQAAKATGASLTGINANSLTLQSDFQQQVSTVNSYADALRMAGVTGHTMRQAMADMVGPLLHMAAGAKGNTAQLRVLAQEAGLTLGHLRSLAQATGDNAARMHNLEGITQALGVNLNDLAKAAQNLDTSMQQAILSTFTQAQVKSSGLSGAIQILKQNTQTYGDTLQGPTSAAGRAIITILEGLGVNAKQAAADELIMAQNALTLAQHLNALHSKSITVAVNYAYTHSGSPGYAGGGPQPHAQAGASYLGGGPTLVGELGPEILNLPAGSSVTPSWQTAGLMHGAPAVGPIVVEQHQDIHVNLDGEEIWRNQQRRTFAYNTLSSGSRTGKVIPGR